jgi:hypothetical protein
MNGKNPDRIWKPIRSTPYTIHGMRRKIIYTLAFIGLMAIAAFLIVTNRNSTIQRRNMNFALTEPSLVDRIVIRNKTIQMDIEKDGDTWRINGKYPARTKTVTLFLQAMGRIEVLSPASKSILDTLTRRIDERGIQLKLYHRNRPLTSVKVYYEKELIPGTYMMDERFRAPFRVGLTGYEGDNFTELFNPAVSLWKDNVLMDYRPEDIAVIRMEYPLFPGQSFIITANPGQAPRLLPVRGSATQDLVDQQEVTDYLTFFNDVPYQLEENSRYDSSGLKEIFAILTLTDKTKHVFQMKAFRIPDPGGSGYDVNHYIAVLAGDSLPLIVNYFDTDPIMKSYRDFLKK